MENLGVGASKLLNWRELYFWIPVFFRRALESHIEVFSAAGTIVIRPGIVKDHSGQLWCRPGIDAVVTLSLGGNHYAAPKGPFTEAITGRVSYPVQGSYSVQALGRNTTQQAQQDGCCMVSAGSSPRVYLARRASMPFIHSTWVLKGFLQHLGHCTSQS